MSEQIVNTVTLEDTKGAIGDGGVETGNLLLKKSIGPANVLIEQIKSSTGNVTGLLNELPEIKTGKRNEDNDRIEQYLEDKEKNKNMFDKLYLKYYDKVLGKCITLLKNKEIAKDATQDVFLKVLLKLEQFGGRSKFSTWVYSITYNYCIDLIRKDKKEKDISIDIEDVEKLEEIVEEVPDNEFLEIEDKKLQICLNKIPLLDKAVLLMKYKDEMSIKEISEIILKSESAVKMKIKRAKHKIKKVYREEFNGTSPFKIDR